jgi:hypothetical protein|tara:strand:+ start:468 stop:1043 length:576 start_codon:yes stop_codon:yes gene_type:complete
MLGPIALHWDKVSNGERGKGWRDHLADLATLPLFSPLRVNQVGDLPHSGGRISRRYLVALLDVIRRRKLRAWTYTHHDLAKGENAALLRRAFRSGLTINVSTESVAAADAAIAAGLPATITVPSTEKRTQWRTPDRNLVYVCPEQQRDGRDVTCADCTLCHKRGKRVIIAFPAHGTRKATADQLLKDINNA